MCLGDLRIGLWVLSSFVPIYRRIALLLFDSTHSATPTILTAHSRFISPEVAFQPSQGSPRITNPITTIIFSSVFPLTRNTLLTAIVAKPDTRARSPLAVHSSTPSSSLLNTYVSYLSQSLTPIFSCPHSNRPSAVEALEVRFVSPAIFPVHTIAESSLTANQSALEGDCFYFNI